MIAQEEFATRRRTLMDAIPNGDLIFLEGESTRTRNPSADLPFRQNSMIRYLADMEIPDAAMLLVPAENRFILFAPKPDLNTMLWTGPMPSLDEIAHRAGADEVLPYTQADLSATIQRYKSNNSEGHSLSGMSGSLHWRDNKLARAIVEQRLVKSRAEVDEIECAIDVTAEMYSAVTKMLNPQATEREIRAAVIHAYEDAGATYSFQPIITTDGYVLHNLGARDKPVGEGKLLLVDSGAELTYDGDITRIYPTSGKFSSTQRAVYEIVLNAQDSAIAAIKPGKNWRELHLDTERILAQGLVNIGALHGSVDEILRVGAHRLFFYHGLGHAIGLDCHDCEEYEDIVAGYDKEPRSTEFGLKKLRFARNLVPGNVMTVEPGLYFNPLTIANPDFYVPGSSLYLNQVTAKALTKEVGGIRIEDDVLVTEKGSRVLGTPIAKYPTDIEAILARR